MEFAAKLSKTTVNILSGLYVIPPSSHFSVSVSVSLIIIGSLERICVLVLSSCHISSSTAPRLFLLLLFKQPCCIYKQNLRFKNHRIFFQLQSHLCILATSTSAINPQNFATAKLSVFREWRSCLFKICSFVLFFL